MTDEATQATAENLRADFLNATTTSQRWKVLNRAIEWAVTASENAAAYRSAYNGNGHISHVAGSNRVIFQEGPVRGSIAQSGAVTGPGTTPLVGEKSEGEDHTQFFGQTFNDPLIVNSRVHPDDTNQGVAENVNQRQQKTRAANGVSSVEVTLHCDDSSSNSHAADEIVKAVRDSRMRGRYP